MDQIVIWEGSEVDSGIFRGYICVLWHIRLSSAARALPAIVSRMARTVVHMIDHQVYHLPVSQAGS